jgi:hypothetical protein
MKMFTEVNMEGGLSYNIQGVLLKIKMFYVAETPQGGVRIYYVRLINKKNNYLFTYVDNHYVSEVSKYHDELLFGVIEKLKYCTLL